MPAVFLAFAAALATTTLPAEGRFPELRFVPKSVEALLAFDRSAPGELLNGLQAELLFATRAGEGLPLAAVTAAGVDRVVVAARRRGADRREAFALLHGAPDAVDAALRELGASSYPLPVGEMSVARAKEARPLGWARLDARTLVLGAPPAVQRCLELWRSALDWSVAGDPKLRSLLQEAAGAPVFGLLQARWLAPEDAPSPLPFPTVGRSLAALRRATFRADVGSDVAFRMRTELASEADAEVLADALRGFLASSRMAAAGPAPVRQVLQEARVERAGADIVLSLSVSAEAMARIKNNEISRRLLTWRLGADERERRERVEEILGALQVRRGSRVADIGAGLGFYTVILARAVGHSGRVVAVDISEKAVAELRQRVAEAPCPQVEVILGAPDDPRLPPDSLDAALIVNSYHEMPQHRQMLDHIRRALRPGGRLVLLEPFSRSKRAEPRESQEQDHVLAPELVVEDLRQAGLEVVSRDDDFVREPDADRGDWLIVARRPPAKRL